MTTLNNIKVVQQELILAIDKMFPSVTGTAPIFHVSLDLWNTLISPNPSCAKQRNAELAAYLNVDVAQVAEAYRTVKLLADNPYPSDTTLTTDKNYSLFKQPAPTATECVGLFLRLLKKSDSAAAIDDVSNIIVSAHMDNPPLIPDDMVEAIALISTIWTVSISSNLNFIPATVMRKLLKDLPIYPQLMMFSNEIGYAKPSPLFFDEVVKKIQTEVGPRIERKNIIHIGDDICCDYYGALLSDIYSICTYETTPHQNVHLIRSLYDI